MNDAKSIARQSLKELNEQHHDDILSIVQHYGKCPNAEQARITNVDDNSATFEWQWTDPSNGAVHVKTRRMSISSSESLNEILTTAALSRKFTQQAANGIDNITLPPLPPSQFPLPQSRTITFTLPPPIICVATLGGLAMLTYFARTKSEITLVQMVFWVVPQWVFRFGFKALVAIHVFEAVAMLLASTTLLYVVSTLVFGFFAGITLARQIRQPNKA
ncbi:hypothetical protein BX661DRAFT_181869 [Kickxella alabastrina]|uniref:uncharacterized protein n=1 Tax=Kickxella alabastrina TaxID=61397 RepID=UPI00221E5BB0|nr:uncharacterized protein BX661DRAFT_181869 [Kickxella alabastrina]KAI7828316.1 hypothetical protein BX661DRAFT_181869 [Kickxella alabastrina]